MNGDSSRVCSFRLTDEAAGYLDWLVATRQEARIDIMSAAVVAYATGRMPAEPPVLRLLSQSALTKLRALNVPVIIALQELLRSIRQLAGGEGETPELRDIRQAVFAALRRVESYEAALRSELTTVGQIRREHGPAAARVYQLALQLCIKLQADPAKAQRTGHSAADWWEVADLCQALWPRLSTLMPMPPKPLRRPPSGQNRTEDHR